MRGTLGVPMFRRLIVAIVIPPLLSTGGCSFLFTETVPDNPTELKYFDCTNTPGLAVADGVIAVANGVTGVSALTQSKEEFSDKNDGASRDLIAGVSLGFAALMVASGIYGIVQSQRCRGAKDELQARLLAPEHETTRRALTPEAPGAPPPAAAPEAKPPAGQAGEIKMLETPPPPPEQAPVAPAPH
ncbi:MAG TPA: hypothetical protein VJV78_20695 [Polyangiales bacterium]|nr:hypothetical protein [Polyangiales bacterium]